MEYVKDLSLPAMSKWYGNFCSPDQLFTNNSRIPSFDELVRSFDSSNDYSNSSKNSHHFEAHYKVRILPKECSLSPSQRLHSKESCDLKKLPVTTCSTGLSTLLSSTCPTSSEVRQLIQNYIIETKKLITGFERFEDDFKDSSYPRTLPEDSINELANVHQSASKALLNIRKSYQREDNTQIHPSENKKKLKVSKCSKDRSTSSTKKADHSVVAFTIKAAKPQTSMISELSPAQDYLNKELCLKTHTVCTLCGSTQTPEWRSGPSGSRTLCNACGLFYSKLVKKLGVASACDCLKKRKRSIGVQNS